MSSQDAPLNTRNLGILPIPRYLQYDPQRPFTFSLALNILFGFTSTMTVCNLYYCQPLLVQFAKTFDVSQTEVAIIPTLTQAGYAAGLVFLTPLGDLVPRRPLLLLLRGLLVPEPSPSMVKRPRARRTTSLVRAHRRPPPHPKPHSAARGTSASLRRSKGPPGPWTTENVPHCVPECSHPRSRRNVPRRNVPA